MRLEFDDEERALVDGIERLVAGCAAGPGSEADRARNLWERLTEDGWTLLPLPESHGGMGSGRAMVGALMEQVGKHGLTIPFLSVILLGARIVATTGGHDDLISAATTGASRIVLAHEELGIPFDAPRRMAAHREGQGWRLTGRKVAALGAPASHFIVSATSDDGPALFLVESNAEGLQLLTYPTLRGEEASDIEFDTLVPASALLASDNLSFSQCLAEARVALCWEAVGAMRWLLQTTVDYVGLRQQFGRTLAAFQVVQHRIAEMAVQLEDAHAATMLATLVPGERLERAAAVAKVVVGAAASQIAEQAIQLHGAMGVTEELAVGRYVRLLTASNQLVGGSDAMLARYADLVVRARDERVSAVVGAA